MKSTIEQYKDLLLSEVPPIKLGNKNKTGKCGMCGKVAGKLHPEKVGQVELMICDRCKSIMDM